ncbi:hypothetical protein ABH923_000463 [Leifsonia sp. EB41]|uniref:hypothetical protein n=1 Tax=Leifsonia sp. EB41 TaxID=3156260 RepID=UPI003514DB80
MPLPELLEEPELSLLLPLPEESELDEPELLDPELLDPELLDPELLVPDVLVPVVLAVEVPANRKPDRIPVTARLEMPIAVVIPMAVRRPADRMSMSGLHPAPSAVCRAAFRN